MLALQGGFYLLMAGLALGSLVMAGEKIQWKIRDKRGKKRERKERGERRERKEEGERESNNA